MSRFLLDTNVLAEFARRDGPNERVKTWLRETARELQFVSVITIAEIDRGIQLLDAGRRRSALEAWLSNGLEVWFAGRILPVTRPVAAEWAKLQAEHSRGGRTLAVIDSLIAATALVHDLELVTRNVRHHKILGVKIVNPWTA